MIKVLALAGMVLFLAGCSRPPIYESFDEIFEWSEIENLGQDDGIHFIYYFNRDFFGTECTGCQIVRDDLLQWMQQNEDYHLYLINERVVSGIRPVGVRSAPSLLLMHQGRVVHVILGAGPILEFLNQVDEGNIEIQDFKPLEED